MSTRQAHLTTSHANTRILDLFRLDGRTIVITGGGGAVGLEVARSVLESGGNAICVDLAAEPLQDEWERAQHATNGVDGKLTYISCDITDSQAFEKALATAFNNAEYPFRGLVTCHGISAGGPAAEFSLETTQKLLDVNFKGTLIAAQICAKHLRQTQGHASFVFVASMSAHGSNKGVDTAVYNSSKAAVVQLGRSLAAEWGSSQDYPLIRVNTISPGYIRTRQTSETLAKPGFEEQWSQDNMMMRLSHADEYRGAVQYLLSDASSFVTGSDIRVDGGHTAW